MGLIHLPPQVGLLAGGSVNVQTVDRTIFEMWLGL